MNDKIVRKEAIIIIGLLIIGSSVVSISIDRENIHSQKYIKEELFRRTSTINCQKETSLYTSQNLVNVFDSPLIVNHTAVLEFNQIPDYWINRTKDEFYISYGHTSHGSQIITGLNIINSATSETDNDCPSCDEYGAGGCNYSFCDDYSYYIYGSSHDKAPNGTLSLWDRRIAGAYDLGNPNRTAWYYATRNHLDNPDCSSRNLIIWSWCGQAGTATEEEIEHDYLENMNQLEIDYPDVTFVYMTGHLDGGGPSGNLYQRNDQIRTYCIENNKVLFDFADIESWDPDGAYYPDESDYCSWCYDWCNDNPGECPSCSVCAHSHCFNCYNKGKAFWWMLAKLAGWESTQPLVTVDISSDMTVVPRFSTFFFSVNITNYKETTETVMVWTAGQKLPMGSIHEPVKGPVIVTLDPGESKIYYYVPQYIGCGYGNYRYYARIGESYPLPLMDEDYLEFQVVP